MTATLVVEDGTGLATANSYQTKANAILKIEELQSLMGLTSAPTIANDVSLISGARYIDAVYGLYLMGQRLNSDQALEYPRVNVPKDAQGLYYYDSDVMPTPLLFAHALASYYCENEPTLIIPNQSAPGTIKSYTDTLGPLSETKEYIGGQSQYKKYSLIDEYMKKLTISSNMAMRV